MQYFHEDRQLVQQVGHGFIGRAAYLSPMRTLHFGITGGIGSGKTTVCRIFETLGIPVYYADDEAKALMTTDATLRTQLIDTFGPTTYLPDGTLNRPYLADLVFNNPDRLATLNGLVHPAVARHSAAWQATQSGVPYTLKEAALLFETGGEHHLDGVITVTAPEALRLQRVQVRDGVTAEQVRARMARQLPEADKRARADYLIHNDGEQALIPQVLAIHRQLLSQTMTHTLQHDPDRKQYYFELDTGRAHIDYIRAGDRIYLTHTEVPPALEGQGIGSALVKQTLEAVEEGGWQLIPQCPFVKAYIMRHPEWARLVR